MVSEQIINAPCRDYSDIFVIKAGWIRYEADIIESHPTEEAAKDKIASIQEFFENVPVMSMAINKAHYQEILDQYYLSSEYARYINYANDEWFVEAIPFVGNKNAT